MPRPVLDTIPLTCADVIQPLRDSEKAGAQTRMSAMQARKMLASYGILDVEAIYNHAHFGSLLLASGSIMNASSGDRPPARSRLAPFHEANNKGTRLRPGLSAGGLAREIR